MIKFSPLILFPLLLLVLVLLGQILLLWYYHYLYSTLNF